ncbi:MULTISPECIES: YlzJ-like family protein [unclassified Virgibacillus]|uniref:YlzJ-like family protein n=1 Tax=unclassified Virgibacillus TaxID=2620237 RepID=UPI0024DEAB19|nr:YlzJ-like family protein [Virgibacillus sp. LDC-1]
MILYTPLSASEIFPVEEEKFQHRHCVSYQGKMIYVEDNQDGTYQVLQLLSSDPQDFLNDGFSPGTILK